MLLLFGAVKPRLMGFEHCYQKELRKTAKERAPQVDCKAALPSLLVMLSAAFTGHSSLQSVKSWLFWCNGQRDHADISTFQTRSERPGVHEDVAEHTNWITKRGHEACFKFCSCRAHILVCCDLSIWQDYVLCRASLDPSDMAEGRKACYQARN